MKTLIAHGHVIDHVTHELTDAEAARITTALALQGIHVTPVVDVYHHLHLWPTAPLTTVQEVRAIAAYRAKTDARIVWERQVPS